MSEVTESRPPADPEGIDLISDTPPSRVENPFANPASSSGPQTSIFNPSRSRQRKPASVRISSSEMILSIGIDIVEVYRMRDSISRTPRFSERVFTEAERAYCDSKGAAAFQSYAGRFAAKEAFLKALKTGWRGKITWQDIEVISDPEGVPSLNITNEAARLLDAMDATGVHLSISHTKDHAVAQVIIEQ